MLYFCKYKSLSSVVQVAFKKWIFFWSKTTGTTKDNLFLFYQVIIEKSELLGDTDRYAVLIVHVERLLGVTTAVSNDARRVNMVLVDEALSDNL